VRRDGTSTGAQPVEAIAALTQEIAHFGRPLGTSNINVCDLQFYTLSQGDAKKNCERKQQSGHWETRLIVKETRNSFNRSQLRHCKLSMQILKIRNPMQILISKQDHANALDIQPIHIHTIVLPNFLTEIGSYAPLPSFN
jgi:hypothetical protein